MIYLIYSVTFSLIHSLSLSLSLNIFISMKIVINWIKDTIFTSSDEQRRIKISNLLAKPHTLAEYNDEKNSTQKKVEIPTTEYSMFEKNTKRQYIHMTTKRKKIEKEKPH